MSTLTSTNQITRRKEHANGESSSTSTGSNTRHGEPKRMTITLPVDAVKLLDFLASTQGVSQVEAIRRAISTEAFIQGEVQEGSRILIETASGNVKELVFR